MPTSSLINVVHDLVTSCRKEKYNISSLNRTPVWNSFGFLIYRMLSFISSAPFSSPSVSPTKCMLDLLTLSYMFLIFSCNFYSLCTCDIPDNFVWPNFQFTIPSSAISNLLLNSFTELLISAIAVIVPAFLFVFSSKLLHHFSLIIVPNYLIKNFKLGFYLFEHSKHRCF